MSYLHALYQRSKHFTANISKTGKFTQMFFWISRLQEKYVNLGFAPLGMHALEITQDAFIMEYCTFL